MCFDDFIERYSDNDKCLEIVKTAKFPDGIFCKTCNKVTTFYKVKTRPVYECTCGYQVSPLKDTIFENSHVTLRDWFYAIFVMSSTRCGFSAAQLKREINVNYKTAWRMLHVIRKAMASNGSYLLKGIVEVDETYLGGKPKRTGKWGGGVENKEAVMGMVERDGQVIMRHIPNTGGYTFINNIKETVRPGTFVITDQHPGYLKLPKYGYPHDYVVHRKEYVKPGTNVHTQTIESRWGTLKRSLSGTYRKASKKWLQNYLYEFEWRYNHRKEPEKMFDLLLNQTIFLTSNLQHDKDSL